MSGDGVWPANINRSCTKDTHILKSTNTRRRTRQLGCSTRVSVVEASPTPAKRKSTLSHARPPPLLSPYPEHFSRDCMNERREDKGRVGGTSSCTVVNEVLVFTQAETRWGTRGGRIEEGGAGPCGCMHGGSGLVLYRNSK